MSGINPTSSVPTATALPGAVIVKPTAETTGTTVTTRPEIPVVPTPPTDGATITPGVTNVSAGQPVTSNVGDRVQIRNEINSAFENYPVEKAEARPIFNRMLDSGIPVDVVSQYIQDTGEILRTGNRTAFAAQIDRMDSISQGRNERADADLDAALAEVDASTRSDGTVTLSASSARNILARVGVTAGFVFLSPLPNHFKAA